MLKRYFRIKFKKIKEGILTLSILFYIMLVVAITSLSCIIPENWYYGTSSKDTVSKTSEATEKTVLVTIENVSIEEKISIPIRQTSVSSSQDRVPSQEEDPLNSLNIERIDYWVQSKGLRRIKDMIEYAYYNSMQSAYANVRADFNEGIASSVLITGNLDVSLSNDLKGLISNWQLDCKKEFTLSFTVFIYYK